MMKRDTTADLPHKAIILKTLELISESGWVSLDLKDVATSMGVEVGVIYKQYPSKFLLLVGIVKFIEAESLKEIDTESWEGMDKSDQLFDVMMGRFEALTPHKKAVDQLFQEAQNHPTEFIESITLCLNSVRAMMQLSGYDMAGIKGEVQVRLFSLIYLKVIYQWLSDDSEDMSKTMAQVDKATKKYLPYVMNPLQLFDFL